MRKLIILFCLISSTLAFEVKRDDVSSMLGEMVKKGILTQAQADDAKKKMSGMSDQQWDDVQKQGAVMAKQMANGDKKVAPGVDSAAQNINLDSKEFKEIQKKMSELLK